MSVGGEFGRRVSDDELCAAVRQAVGNNDEDSLRRLGFGGFAEYAQRLSELMSDSVCEGHDPQAEDFAAIMEEVARPAHYAHHLVNEAGTAVQRAKDEPLGIHMKPIETDFDDEAFRSTVGNAASMDTPEKTVEALTEGLAYAVKKLGNDFIKANAEAHSRAGFEVKVKRSGSTKCCPWCAARIGSWAIANAPDGVFGCHANCSCTVEYTSSTGAVSRREGTGRFVEVDYQPPHVLSHEEAREKGGFDEPKRLTKNPVESQPHRLTGEKGISGKQSSRTEENTVDLNYINSEEYKHKFRGITGNDKVDRQLYNQAVAQLIHRNGTYGEDLTLINSLSGEIEGRQSKSKTENGVDYNRSLTRAIKNNPPYSLISIHNHGTNNPPTGSDLASNGGRKYKLGIVVTHNGRVFTYKAGNKPFHSKSFDYVVDKNRSKGYNEFDAIIETLKQYERDYGIEWSER